MPATTTPQSLPADGTLPPLAGFTVGITADRRRDELAGLLARRGAKVVHGPSLATEYLHDDAGLRAVTEALIARPPTYLVGNTGIGLRAWIGAAETWAVQDGLVATMRSAAVVARGAKVTATLSAHGIEPVMRAEHETLDELEAWLLARPDLRGALVAVQLHGDQGLAMAERLRRAGAEVVEVPVYRWLLPDDVGPARRLIEAACDGRVDAVTFTSAPAVRNLLRLADEMGLGPRLREAFADRVVPACVGPVCASPLVEQGIPVPVAPDVGRLGLLVRALSDHLAATRRHLTLAGIPVTLSGSLAVLPETGTVLELPARERGVLDALAATPGAVISPAALLSRVWGTPQGDPHLVETTVARLRRRLGPAGKGIVTLRRRGYRLEEQPGAA
jgi:uroporphyrinogen-III synthase